MTIVLRNNNRSLEKLIMSLDKNNKICEDVYIFDTNIFLTGIDFNLINDIIYCTQSVIDEIKVNKYKEEDKHGD